MSQVSFLHFVAIAIAAVCPGSLSAQERSVYEEDFRFAAVEIEYSKANPVPWGPAFFPKDLDGSDPVI